MRPSRLWFFFSLMAGVLAGIFLSSGLQRAISPAPAPAVQEKFTYSLVLICFSIMVLTGLILWFPVIAASHLPGEAIALAASMHSHQALVVLLGIRLARPGRDLQPRCLPPGYQHLHGLHDPGPDSPQRPN